MLGKYFIILAANLPKIRQFLEIQEKFYKISTILSTTKLILSMPKLITFKIPINFGDIKQFTTKHEIQYKNNKILSFSKN